jgi:hypothetical protein
MLPLRVLSACFALWTLLLAGVAAAQAEAPKPRELRAVPGGVLVVTLKSDAGFDVAAVRGAIARELGVRVEDPATAPPGSARLDLEIGDQGRQLDARYVSQDRTIRRTIRLPEDRQAALETTALLAGNLVRNEAEELLAELERQRAAVASEAGPAPAASESRAPTPAPAVPAKPEPAAARPQAKPEAKKPAQRRPPTATVPVNLTLYHPALSLHRHSERYTFALELGLVYARLGRIEGAALDLFVHRIDHGVDGAALTSIWSHVDGPVRGAVMSAVGSSGTGDLQGAQLTGIVALHRGSLAGVQGSSVALAWGDVEGAQLAFVNWAERIEGAQLGVVNVAQRAVGAELGVVNVSQEIEGTQLGAANINQDLDGMQIGVLNVSGHSRGTQIGVLNVAGTADGEQIGLINIGSRIRPTSWADVDADGDLTLHAGLKFQSRTFYSLFGFGVAPAPGAERRYVSTAAIGLRVAPEPLFFQIDAGMIGQHASDFSGDSPGLLRYRGMLGLDLASWLSIYAGGGVEHEILPDQGPPRGLALAGIELL